MQRITQEELSALIMDNKDGSVRNGVVNYEFTAQSGDCSLADYTGRWHKKGIC